jgi:hypothetical protein
LIRDAAHNEGPDSAALAIPVERAGPANLHRAISGVSA